MTKRTYLQLIKRITNKYRHLVMQTYEKHAVRTINHVRLSTGTAFFELGQSHVG